MEVLSIATGNASEIIGEGLVAALARVGGGTEASDAATAIETLAKAFNFVTLATGTVIGGITSVIRTLKNLPKNIFEGFAGKQGGINISPIPKVDPKVSLSDKKQQEMLAKLEAASVKRNKELLALKKKQVATDKLAVAEKKKQEALEKAALLLAQGQKLFDEEGIQLAAAAQGKLTDEERTRLALKKDIYDLEAAINEGNISAAARLSNSMVANAQKLSAIRGDMIGLNDIENPFTAWLNTLIALALELAKLAKPLKLPFQFLPAGGTAAEIAANVEQYQKLTDQEQIDAFGGLLSDAPPRISSPFTEGPDAARFYNQMGMSGTASGGTVVNISVAGSVTTERDLVAAITQGLYSQQASGTPVLYSTVY
jgi:hypothetical protein